MNASPVVRSERRFGPDIPFFSAMTENQVPFLLVILLLLSLFGHLQSPAFILLFLSRISTSRVFNSCVRERPRLAAVQFGAT